MNPNFFPNGIQRVLLVNPPGVADKDFRLDMAKDRRYWSYPCYGCAVLAANLKRAGYEVKIEDLNFYTLGFAVHFEVSPGWRWHLDVAIGDFRPDIVCISVMFTMQHEPMKEIARLCRQLGYPVMVGGVHPTNAKDFILTEECVDILGLYECDTALPIFFDAVNGKRDWNEVGQIIIKVNPPRPLGGLITREYMTRLSPETEDLIQPDYCGLDLTKYENIGQVGTYSFLRPRTRRASSVLSTRGCRAKCSFCSVRYFNGPGVRVREVQSVLDEIRSLYDQGIGHITWLDDDLLSGKKRAMDLFNGIAKMKLDLTWDASNGLIAAAIDAENLEAMVKSGCVGFNLGIESGSPEILRSVHKPGTVESFRKCAALTDKYPELFIKAFVICGYPGETLAQMWQTVSLCVELKYDWCALQILHPLPSTEIYRSMADQGFLSDNIDTEGKSFTAGVFSSLNLRKREEEGREQAEIFYDPFSNDHSYVPTKEDMADIWLSMDFYMNYAPIPHMPPGPKLENKRKILIDICDRITRENPLANYYLAVAHRTAGDRAESERAGLAIKYLKQSDFWRKRFAGLGISWA